MTRLVAGLFMPFAFILQNSVLLKWSRGDSNPWPPPCKVRDLSSRSFAIVQKILQNGGFIYVVLRGCSPSFVWVGVLLVYKRCEFGTPLVIDFRL
jgi:hypothetical protein